jgi:hypothetical protein
LIWARPELFTGIDFFFCEVKIKAGNMNTAIKIGIMIPAAIVLTLAYLQFFGKKSSNQIETSRTNIISTMNLTSNAFANNGNLPSKYTCDGQKINPELLIGGTPQEAKSLVLIVDDPDAPAGIFTHWTVWNIDPSARSIEENSVPAGAIQGMATSDGIGYVSPCPPGGTHRYRFKLYALDTMLDLRGGASVSELSAAMSGHVVDLAELTSFYQRR